jgi:hypothetical protein
MRWRSCRQQQEGQGRGRRVRVIVAAQLSLTATGNCTNAVCTRHPKLPHAMTVTHLQRIRMA